MGRCFRSFLKEEAKETKTDVNGFPEYQRRLTGPDAHLIPVLGVHRDVSNSWVVPYNPYLLVKYMKHINVEICTSLKSFKSIYKYIHKGEIKLRLGLELLMRKGHMQTWMS